MPLAGGDDAFAIACPRRGGQELAKNEFNSPGCFELCGTHCNLCDVTLMFVFSSIAYHRHVNKNKYLQDRMHDVMFDRTQAWPLFCEVMVVHADVCACSWQHWRFVSPYQHSGHAHPSVHLLGVKN